MIARIAPGLNRSWLRCPTRGSSCVGCLATLLAPRRQVMDSATPGQARWQVLPALGRALGRPRADMTGGGAACRQPPRLFLDRPLASGWAAAIGARAAAKPFFECLLGGWIGFGVPRPWRLPGQVEAPHQLGHAAVAVGHARALLDDPAEVDHPSGRDPIRVRIPPLQHDRLQRRLLSLGQTAGAPVVRLVRSPGRSAAVVADHAVPQRLPIHLRRAGCRLPARSLQRRRDRQQTARHPRIPLHL